MIFRMCVAIFASNTLATLRTVTTETAHQGEFFVSGLQSDSDRRETHARH